MTSDTATAESWRSYNLPHIESLKSKAQEPGISLIVKIFRIWRANRAIERRNKKTFSNIGMTAVRLMERDRADGKRLVIVRKERNGSPRVVFEPTFDYPKLTKR